MRPRWATASAVRDLLMYRPTVGTPISAAHATMAAAIKTSTSDEPAAARRQADGAPGGGPARGIVDARGGLDRRQVRAVGGQRVERGRRLVEAGQAAVAVGPQGQVLTAAGPVRLLLAGDLGQHGGGLAG